MDIRYICIEREYGSGGTKIARQAAERCGISCYGREIMENVAKKEQIGVKTLEEYEESVSGSILYSMFVISQSQTGDPDLLSQEGKLYVAETRVIRELSKSGPAIFVGHCASHALKDEQGVLRVFICGDEADKQQRIIQDYGIDRSSVAAECKRVNRRRSNYYSLCTQKKWTDMQNYDIVMDSSRLGLDGCADVLCALYNNKH